MSGPSRVRIRPRWNLPAPVNLFDHRNNSNSFLLVRSWKFFDIDLDQEKKKKQWEHQEVWEDVRAEKAATANETGIGVTTLTIEE